jgi:hypothetical protein
MQQRTQKAGGLIRRILLGGAMIFGGSGCVPLTSVQEARLFGLTTMAQREVQARRRDKAIRESGPVVNVNVPQNQNYQKSSFHYPPPSFVCKDYKDFNNDGYIEKNELIGAKNYFKCGNEYTKDNPLKIKVGGIWKNVSGQNVLIKIKENNEKIVRLDEQFIDFDAITWTPLDFYKGNQIQGIHEYKAEFYKNGQLDSSKSISFFIDYGKKRENLITVDSE